MITMQVTYTTRAEFAEQNRANIQAVMQALHEHAITGLFYTAVQAEDGKTFVHTAFMRGEAEQQMLNELPEFRHFQSELKASQPEALPRLEQLTLVGASAPILRTENTNTQLIQ